ncbi:hypothetical protein HDU97_008028 [Phlyctochytrium planicorne]|nr:hypothetical protein HDU97_008028 [Phlyctochytrium planicorne]
MSQIRNRKKGNPDVVAAVSEQLSNSLNDKNPTAAVKLVQYWGNMSQATTARFIGFDDSGVDIEYTLGADTSRKHEIRVQFKAPVSSPAEARQKIEGMVAEANLILGVNVDTTYKAVSAKPKPNFVLPDISIIVAMLIAWGLVFSVRFLEDEALPYFLVVFREAVGRDGTDRLLIALIAINTVLAILSLAFCIFARIPLGATLLWIPTVLIFGIPSMQDCMKVAIRFLLPRYPEFFGIPKGVLPDDPITIANNAKIAEIKQQQENAAAKKK